MRSLALHQDTISRSKTGVVTEALIMPMKIKNSSLLGEIPVFMHFFFFLREGKPPVLPVCFQTFSLPLNKYLPRTYYVTGAV